jgi:hypothetical protein
MKINTEPFPHLYCLHCSWWSSRAVGSPLLPLQARVPGPQLLKSTCTPTCLVHTSDSCPGIFWLLLKHETWRNPPSSLPQRGSYCLIEVKFGPVEGKILWLNPLLSVVDNSECQFDWVERHLGHLWGLPLGVCVRAFQHMNRSWDSDLISGLLHWWIQNVNRLLEDGGTLGGGTWLGEAGC